MMAAAHTCVAGVAVAAVGSRVGAGRTAAAGVAARASLQVGALLL